MTSATQDRVLPGAALPIDRMPGHWLLARLGKRVLRPGGREMTEQILDALAIGASDDVVEIAPGLGSTTKLVLERGPRSYVGVDRDPDAAGLVGGGLDGVRHRVINASAVDTGLPDASAHVAFGEAFLTMQPARQKARIFDELARIVAPGGRIGLHEVAVSTDGIGETGAEAIADELTKAIKVNVSPLTAAAWIRLVEDAGFEVVTELRAPLHLLEPRRLVADEGVVGAVRFVGRVLRDPHARARVRAMRAAMHRRAEHLEAFALVAVRRQPSR